MSLFHKYRYKPSDGLSTSLPSRNPNFRYPDTYESEAQYGFGDESFFKTSLTKHFL